MSRIRVMIIDSQPLFRAGVRQALTQQKTIGIIEILECDPGDKGTEAIEQITASSADVALLQACYPDTRNLEVARRITRYFPNTKVVMLSSYPDENDEELFEVIKTGAVAYLRSRYCTPAQLVETIRRASCGEYPINDDVNSRPKVAWRVLRQFQDISTTRKTVDEITTPLTAKEMQVLNHLVEGRSNKLIANVLCIKEQTIKNHVSAILRKLNANCRAHAVSLALRDGLISAQIGMATNGDGEMIQAKPFSEHGSTASGSQPIHRQFDDSGIGNAASHIALLERPEQSS